MTGSPITPDNGPDVPGPLAPDLLLEGYDTVLTDLSSYTLPDNVEKLSYFSFPGGPQLDFTGTGNAENNDISGGGGNDTLGCVAKLAHPQPD
jgi:hypothetical protein